MRFATIRTPNYVDGRPCLVSPCGSALLPIPADIGPSLLQIVERWSEVSAQLKLLYEQACQYPPLFSEPCSHHTLAAPFPRSWGFLDGSAFLSHVLLARKARGVDPPPDLHTRPLMYQGGSDSFSGAEDALPIIDPQYGYDYEGEFCVVTSHIPQGSTPARCLQGIVLVLLMNDLTLRNLVPIETATGFGFVQSKPPSAFAPFAVTPEYLGAAWQNGRVQAELTVLRNGKLQGHPSGALMHFHFGELIAHAARTRPLAAGTIVGSGTVSSSDAACGTCCIAEQRAREQIGHGQPHTPFLQVGEDYELYCMVNNQSIFGSIRQRCIPAGQ